MPTNQYLPFATSVSPAANTLTYAAYNSHALRAGGHVPGVALSELVNTTFRQTSVAAAGVAKFATDNGPNDCLDDGSPANFAAAVLAAVQAIVAGYNLFKPGDVKGTLVSTVPTGWLKANGQIVSRATYAALFTAIGTTYGAGDGTTTFQLPDMRGEFLRGWDDGRGVDSGRALGSAQADELKSHTHGGVALLSNDIDRGSASSLFSIDELGVTSATGGTETRPRNVAVLWLIKT